MKTQDSIIGRLKKQMFACLCAAGAAVALSAIYFGSLGCDDKAPDEGKSTISSFCGITFGESLASYGRVSVVDETRSHREYVFSFASCETKLSNSFRKFDKAKLYGGIKSQKVYQVEMVYQFPRDNGGTAAGDKAEYDNVVAAIKNKYGVKGSESDGFGGDKSFACKLGDVEVLVKYTAEGTFDRAQIRLTATNTKLHEAAEAESRANYDSKGSKTTGHSQADVNAL